MKKYIIKKVATILVCLTVILTLFPFSSFSKKTEAEGEIDTAILNKVLEGEQQTSITTTEQLNPLNTNWDWFVASAKQGFTFDTRFESEQVYNIPDVTSMYTDITSSGSFSDGLVDQYDKNYLSTSFIGETNGTKSYVAYAGFEKGGDGKYHLTVSVREPLSNGTGELSPVKASVTLGNEYNLDFLTYHSNTSYADEFSHLDIVSGDFNGDGKDTIIVFCPFNRTSLENNNFSTNVYYYELSYNPETDELTTLTKEDRGFHPECMTALNSKKHYGSGAYINITSKFTAGDLNNDGIDDLAYVSWSTECSTAGTNEIYPYVTVIYGKKDTASIHACDSVDNWYIKNQRTTKYGSTYDEIPNTTDLTIGDVDGDGLNELIAGGAQCIIETLRDGSYGFQAFRRLGMDMTHVIGTSDPCAVVIQYKNSNGHMALSNWSLTKASKSGLYSNYDLPHEDAEARGMSEIECVKWNGANSAEYLFMNGSLYDLTNGTPILLQNLAGFECSIDGSYGAYNCVVGNFNGNSDGKEDILFYYLKMNSYDYYGTGSNDKYIESIKIAHNNGTSATTKELFTKNSTNKTYGGDSGSQPVLVAYDLPSQALKLKFSGKVDCYYSDPQVVAVLEAAPYFDELGQDYAGYTTYTIELDYAVGDTTETNSSISTTLGAGLTLLVPYEEITAKRMEASGFSRTISVKNSNTFISTINNSVVLLRIPNYVYYYDVAGSDEKLTVTIPQKPSYTQLSISDYNAFANAYNATYVGSDGLTTYNQFITFVNTLDTNIKQKYSNEIEKIKTILSNPYYVPKLNTITLGTKNSSGGVLPVNNVGHPETYNGAYVNFVNGHFSDSSMELGYNGGASQIASSKISQSTLSSSVTLTDSISHGVTMYLKTPAGDNPVLKLLSLFTLTLTSKNGTTSEIKKGTFQTKGSAEEISGTVKNLDIEELTKYGDLTNATVKQYKFTWSFGSWEFNKYQIIGTNRSSVLNEVVPVVGYKIDYNDDPSKISWPLDPVKNLKVNVQEVNDKQSGDDATVDNKYAIVNISFDYTPTLTRETANRFYIFASDFELNSLKVRPTKGGTLNEPIEWPDEEKEVYYLSADISSGTLNTETNTYSFNLPNVYISRITDGGTERSFAYVTVFAANETTTNFSNMSMGKNAVAFFAQSGESAYEIAIKHGYKGTEAEWLKSLVGDKGDDGLSAYDVAKQNGFVGTEQDWLNSLIGATGQTGKSAYEIARDYGFAGSEEEWIKSLVGEKGDKGDTGEQGEDGNDGSDGVNGQNKTIVKDGLSAYEIAKKNGFEGTEQEFVDAMIKNDESLTIGIVGAKINDERELIFTMSDGSTINAGSIDFESQNYEELSTRLERVESINTAAIIMSSGALGWNAITLLLTLLTKKKKVK